MAVHAGKYKDRITVKGDGGQRSQFGGSTLEKRVIQRPWCKVRHVSDNETNDERPTGQLVLEFEVRYSISLENPTTDMFIEFRGIEYDIISAMNVNMRNEKLLILTKQRR